MTERDKLSRSVIFFTSSLFDGRIRFVKIMINKCALVVFGKKVPEREKIWWQRFEVLVASPELNTTASQHGLDFVNIDSLIEAGSIYEASAFAEELSCLKLSDGSRLAKLAKYQGYELWWLYYDSLFFYFCLPFTQYKKLLIYLREFKQISFYQPPYQSLFRYYLQAYGSKVEVLRNSRFKLPTSLHPGSWLQVLITLLSLPFLIIRKYRRLVFIGDKFDQGQDYDFRMKFIYQELRQRNLPFVEFVRSLESWKTVLQHALIRRRPVIYSEAVTFVGGLLSWLTGGRRRAQKEFISQIPVDQSDPLVRFKFLVAAQHLPEVYTDIWAIRIMKLITRLIGIKTAIIIAATERNLHTVLGCKLNAIPIIGILHGAPTRHYNTYDFLPGFDGEKMLSVDRYGLWSEWWKDYYLKYSRAYRPEQLFVSGLMRPVIQSSELSRAESPHSEGSIKVLFIAEQLAVPGEVLPYLEKLLADREIDLTIKFRPYRDGFEDWLLVNQPALIQAKNLKILRGNIQEAVKDNEVVVGSHSTAVLEALFLSRVPILFKTKKWGDCFGLEDYGQAHPFFAENSDELVDRIKRARTIPQIDLDKLQERYFGDRSRNGSKWVVDQTEEVL